MTTDSGVIRGWIHPERAEWFVKKGTPVQALAIGRTPAPGEVPTWTVVGPEGRRKVAEALARPESLGQALAFVWECDPDEVADLLVDQLRAIGFTTDEEARDEP